jgi:ribonuclease T2
VKALLIATTIFFGLAGGAFALDDCVLDHCADNTAPPIEKPRASETAGGSFDFYVLALSWSPGFCEASGGGRAQCEPGQKRAFVLHGLWPQYERGFPSNCGGVSTPSRLALDRARGVYPDEGLARYEWRKHGTCTGRSPGDYFEDAGRAKDAVTVPPTLANLADDRSLATIDVERAFYEVNPRLRPGMMAVGCERGMLQEVRICLTKDLREFRTCPEVVRHGCRAREIRVLAPY